MTLEAQIIKRRSIKRLLRPFQLNKQTHLTLIHFCKSTLFPNLIKDLKVDRDFAAGKPCFP